MLLPVALTLALTVSLSAACSPPEPMPKDAGFEVAMSLADIVVSGKVKDANVHNTTDINEDIIAAFTVECVYNSPDSNGEMIGSEILINRGARYMCIVHHLENGKRFVVALKNKTAGDEAYSVFEYNLSTAGTYDSTTVDLSKLVEICGFQNRKTLIAGSCQIPKSEQECRKVVGALTSTMQAVVGALLRNS
jgi:hypothetical protein